MVCYYDHQPRCSIFLSVGHNLGDEGYLHYRECYGMVFNFIGVCILDHLYVTGECRSGPLFSQLFWGWFIHGGYYPFFFLADRYRYFTQSPNICLMTACDILYNGNFSLSHPPSRFSSSSPSVTSIVVDYIHISHWKLLSYDLSSIYSYIFTT